MVEMTIKIVTVSELKTNLARIVAQLEADGTPLYVTLHGKPKAVLVQFQEYEALLGKLDDLEDALAMHQALSSPHEEAVSLDEHEHQRTAPVRR